jgi:rhodanese-related sulfurtransferase
MGMSANRVTVDELLADARSSVRRLTPRETKAEMARGLTLVDIRSDAQRDADGLIPSAVYVPRNALEWRLDPACAHRDPDLGRTGARVALICDEGYQSSMTERVLSRGGHGPRIVGGPEVCDGGGVCGSV